MSRMRALVLWLSTLGPAIGQLPPSPTQITGTLGGSVTVECKYREAYKGYSKYWCRGADRSCFPVIQTSNWEEMVKIGRFSIRDDQEKQTFTVTMEALKLRDSGTYQCGITRLVRDSLYQPTRIHVSDSVTLQTPAVSVGSRVPTLTATPSTSTYTSSVEVRESVGARPPGLLLVYLVPAVGVLLLLLLAFVPLIRSRRKKKQALQQDTSQSNDGLQLLQTHPDLMGSPLYAVVRKPAKAGFISPAAIPDMLYMDMKGLAQECSGRMGICHPALQLEDSDQQQGEYVSMQPLRRPLQ
ncbi:CMRF35-like molecule 5 [Ambystoma mexicanum]|uniref:CMRF35-like molecule 5 n=1 Tax=Ambystoma mexicanum TaxID=8296 RepID=UPI0037E9A2F2